MKATEQIAVTLSFQHGPTPDEVHAFILALNEKFAAGNVKLDDCWGLEIYDTELSRPALKITESQCIG